MQVESNIHTKWSRIPAIDVTTMSPDQSWNGFHVPSNITKYSNNNNNNNNNMKYAPDVRMGPDGLPVDPREWTRYHVYLWLVNLAACEGLDGTQITEKFKMNGKALCLMSLEMYLSRVPAGGKILYRDFRSRLTRALSL